MTMQHRHGGTITAITHIGHATIKGVADWFFIGDITWQDGTQSRGREISPTALVYSNEAEHAEIRALLAQLDAYLTDVGEWHEPKHKRDGRMYSWTPREPEGRRAIEG